MPKNALELFQEFESLKNLSQESLKREIVGIYSDEYIDFCKIELIKKCGIALSVNRATESHPVEHRDLKKELESLNKRYDRSSLNDKFVRDHLMYFSSIHEAMNFFTYYLMIKNISGPIQFVNFVMADAYCSLPEINKAHIEARSYIDGIINILRVQLNTKFQGKVDGLLKNTIRECTQQLINEFKKTIPLIDYYVEFQVQSNLIERINKDLKLYYFLDFFAHYTFSRMIKEAQDDLQLVGQKVHDAKNNIDLALLRDPEQTKLITVATNLYYFNNGISRRKNIGGVLFYLNRRNPFEYNYPRAK